MNRPDARIRGLVIPYASKELLDSEYADDTMLYLQGNDANLQKAEGRIEWFCKASGGKINWNKSRGLWVSSNPRPLWCPNVDFQWVPTGMSVKYLGFLVGVETPKNQQLEQVKEKIRKKLRLWASVKLSLAGRVVVVNHILLATMWHSVACWMLDKACIKNIKAMVRGFLWSGRDNEMASAKVAWGCLVKTKNEGGLGLVDPVQQSKALLGKLLVRSLQPGPELWKVLLRNRVDLWCPKNGGPWQANTWWLFSPALKLKEPASMEDRVVRAIMKAWSSLREGLVLMQPKTLDEQLRQPLFWNPRIRSEDGKMLGQQKYLPWGRMLGYKIRSVHDWEVFSMKRRAGQVVNCRITGRLKKVTQLIDGAVDGLDKLTAEETVWSGWFVGEGDAQLIRGRCSTSGDRLWGNLSSLTDDGRWMAVRVAVLKGKWWQLNPDPKTLDHDCKIWLYDNKPLYDLEWDPLEVWWQTPGTKNLKRFFEYNTKLGRRIIGSKTVGAGMIRNRWKDKGISDDDLKAFWRRLWALDMPEKIKAWWWLLSHKAVPVGEWLSSRGGEASCKLCGQDLESISHCFWNCAEAISIWSRSLQIVAACGVKGNVVWGSIQGLSLKGESWGERLNPQGHGFIVQAVACSNVMG